MLIAYLIPGWKRGLYKMINKILIVDDQSSILSGMSRALHKYCDYHGEIMAVESGKKALGEVSTCFYDICFLDLNLPDINGLEIMEQIHSISPKTKVVIMTAEFLEDDLERKITNGAFLFIPKPIELDALKAFIDKELSSNGDYIYKKENNGGRGIIEKRGSERRPHAGTVCYVLSLFYSWELKSNLKADMLDISTGGVCVTTSCRLYPGAMLRFDNSLENRAGTVKWSAADEKGCRAGIKFT
jgi:CheY-like chemotaxis protein